MKRNRRNAFTLVEVMIVVVIMAILAATVIPQFTSSSDDAQESTGLFNLHTLRSQIQLYKAEHRGLVPTDLSELTKGTKVDGSDGTDYGPYLDTIPNSPFSGKNTVTITTDDPPTAATSSATRGWLYNKTKGKVWLDETGYFDK